MERLTDLTVTTFAEVLASDAPAPGGGSVAALFGACGAALGVMTTNLTIGKKKYAELWEHAELMNRQGHMPGKATPARRISPTVWRPMT